MRIGRKFDQPLKDAYPLDLRWQRVAATPEYFETRLTAAEGPVGTRDYRVVVAAVPLEGAGACSGVSALPTEGSCF